MKNLFFLFLAVSSASASHALVRVCYPYVRGREVALRGEHPLSWDRSLQGKRAGNVWSFDLEIPDAIEIKPFLDGRRWSRGLNYRVAPGETLDVFPHFLHTEGRLTFLNGFASPQLGNTRALRIYVPPSYEENTERRYPVVYAQDGQNLFQDETSFGGEWGFDETLDAGVERGDLAEMIVVGVDNTPNRLTEYTFVADPKYGGGEGGRYLKFLVNTVKPFIDKNFRTLPRACHTAVLGSSLGGLFAFQAAWHRPDVFGHAIAMSPSFWWSDARVLRQLSGAKKRDAWFYIDSGDVGPGADGAALCRQVTDALEEIGFRYDRDLVFWREVGASHNESAWRARLQRPLRALSAVGSFPPR